MSVKTEFGGALTIEIPDAAFGRKYGAASDVDTGRINVESLRAEMETTPRLKDGGACAGVFATPPRDDMRIDAAMAQNRADFRRGETKSGVSLAPDAPASPCDSDDGESVDIFSALVNEDPSACLICSDKGSGYHYSVFSCEGCKGFFKRTVQKDLTYKCKDSQICVINKVTRNSCQYCRFQKCLEVGMKREAVREDHTPGGKHRIKRPKIDNKTAPDILKQAVNKMSILGSGVNQSISPLYDEILVSVIKSQATLAPSLADCDPSDLSPQDLMHFAFEELRLLIHWARRVPGFSPLHVDDQMALLKSSAVELLIFRLAYRSVHKQGVVVLTKKIQVTEEQATKIGWGPELVIATLEIVQIMEELNIDETEFSALATLILTYPDAPNLKAKEAAGTIQAKVLDSLRKFTLTKDPNDTRRLGKLLLRLPHLRTVAVRVQERFSILRKNKSLVVNQLVEEVFS